MEKIPISAGANLLYDVNRPFEFAPDENFNVLIFEETGKYAVDMMKEVKKYEEQERKDEELEKGTE